ncbi:MAG: 16S rRNA (cytidine(1402)-2'-O)-methyltransferase [Desulfobacterales bacterium]|jgi:16S rRNA (cytidine1402-2'-O)-methyltransferase
MTASESTPDGCGVLFVVATPIGNRKDITLRALEVLHTVDLVAAEDTRHTGRLLRHHGVRTRLVSYHKFNERQRTPFLIEQLRGGKAVAVVSSAGTPGISDPGGILVREAARNGIRVSPLPGPSAVAAAISVSGLDVDGFLFLGFPPKKTGRRRALLAALAAETRASVWYESPQRVLPLIRELTDQWGNRRAAACRELTKLHEEIIRGRLAEIADSLFQKNDIKGEFVLVVEGSDRHSAPHSVADIRGEILEQLRTSDSDTNRLARDLSDKYGLSKKRVYEEVLKAKGKK